MEMKVTLRVYAQYDPDLIALYRQGISMSAFARNVLYAYANGQDIKFTYPVNKYSQETDSNRTFRVTFKVTDSKSIQVLRAIRDKKRNVFLKTLMRNSLVRQNIGVFFENPKYLREENDRLTALGTEYFVLVPHKRKQITLDDILHKKKTVPDESLKVTPPKEFSSDTVSEIDIETVVQQEKKSAKTKPTATPSVASMSHESPKLDTPDTEVQDTPDISDDEQQDILNMLNSLSEDF